MRNAIALLALILLCNHIQAQIVNTEELRFNATDKSFIGLVDVSFAVVRNKAGVSLRPGADLRFEWTKGKTRWMTLGGYKLSRFTNLNRPGALPTNFTNKGFLHFRYNRQLSQKVTWEIFSQAQFDEIQEIDVRLLNGMGPRFELAASDSTSLYFGVLYMYEYEETSDEPEIITYNKDNRLSSYISLNHQFNEFVGFSNITYFQPNLSDFADYRISVKTLFTARFSKTTALNIKIDFVYDNRPPETVPEAMFDMSTGLSVVF